MWPVPNQKQKGTTKTDKCYFYFFKKTISLALGPRSYPSSQGSASTFSLASSSSSLLHYLGTSLDNLSPRSHQFGLVPLTFRVEELPPMAGYESSLLDKPSEWFLVGLEDLNFKIVREFFVVIFAAMSVHQVFEKW